MARQPRARCTACQDTRAFETSRLQNSCVRARNNSRRPVRAGIKRHPAASLGMAGSSRKSAQCTYFERSWRCFFADLYTQECRLSFMKTRARKHMGQTDETIYLNNASRAKRRVQSVARKASRAKRCTISERRGAGELLSQAVKIFKT